MTIPGLREKLTAVGRGMNRRPSKMNVHLYISSACRDDEPFLRYDAKVVIGVEGSTLKARLPQAVVTHYVERLLNNKEVPFMIEEYLEVRFREEQAGGRDVGCVGEVYLSEMSLADYRTMLRRIAGDGAQCEQIFSAWTTVADNYDTLVCVAETDLCAPFITTLYPPVEMFTRTVIKGGGGGGSGGAGHGLGDGDCDCGCDDE